MRTSRFSKPISTAIGTSFSPSTSTSLLTRQSIHRHSLTSSTDYRHSLTNKKQKCSRLFSSLLSHPPPSLPPSSATPLKVGPLVTSKNTTLVCLALFAPGVSHAHSTDHTRYLALDCQSQHNTTFFDDCCHPLLSNESLNDDRLAKCNPSNSALSSASAYEATVSTTASADVEAASQYSALATSTSYAAESTSAVASAAAVWAEASSAAPSSAAAPSTTTYEAPATSTTEAAATTTAASSNNDVKTGGYATFFYQGGVAGACGTVHSDSDYVIAIDTNGWWQDTSSASPLCGKSITLTNSNNGKSVTAVVADACPSCVSDNSLDLSVGAFNAIASEEDGQVPITWYFN